MKKRLVSLGFVTALSVMALAGCGGGWRNPCRFGIKGRYSTGDTGRADSRNG